jgi:hypothetical protein
MAFMHRVVDAVGDAPGLIEFRCFREAGTSRLLGISRWESDAAFRDALPLVLSLGDERRPEWTDRDDELILSGEF